MDKEKKYKTVNIPVEMIKKIYEIENTSVDADNLHSWINNTIQNSISKSHYLQKTSPQLTLAANSTNGIIVRDQTLPKNQLAEVVFQAKKLFCETCGLKQCAHIDFVRTTSDFGRMIRENFRLT